MTQVYFHCSNAKKVFVDRRGAVVDDLAEARDQRPASCNPSPTSAASRIGVTGSCMSATIRAMSSSLCLSPSCSASPIEGRRAPSDYMGSPDAAIDYCCAKKKTHGVATRLKYWHPSSQRFNEILTALLAQTLFVGYESAW